MEENIKEKRELTKIEKTLIAIIVAAFVLIVFFGIKLFNNSKPEVLSGDKAVCNRINLILEEKKNKIKVNTVSDVLEFLVSEGYLVENLTPTGSDNYYIYNAETNQFVLVDGLSENANVVFGKLSKKNINNWVIVDDQDEFDKTINYSHYLTSAFDGDEQLYVKSGIDAKNCASVKHIVLDAALDEEIVVSYNSNYCDFKNNSNTKVNKFVVD